MTFTLPLRTVSTLNAREHWAARAHRAKSQRKIAAICMRSRVNSRWVAAAIDSSGITVRLERVAPRGLDGDNLQGALKSVRDGVADALGINDNNPRVTWLYGQRRGAAKQYAVEIQILVGGGE